MAIYGINSCTPWPPLLMVPICKGLPVAIASSFIKSNVVFFDNLIAGFGVREQDILDGNFRLAIRRLGKLVRLRLNIAPQSRYRDAF